MLNVRIGAYGRAQLDWLARLRSQSITTVVRAAINAQFQTAMDRGEIPPAIFTEVEALKKR
jgi:hypothetical protein